MYRIIALWFIGMIVLLTFPLNVDSANYTRSVSFPSLSLYSGNEYDMNELYCIVNYSVSNGKKGYLRESNWTRDTYRYTVMKSIATGTAKSGKPGTGVIIQECLGGLLGGAVGGYAVFIATSYIFIEGFGWGETPESIEAVLGLLEKVFISSAIGYVIGVPLGTAAGTSITGQSLHQNGSGKGALVGSALGTVVGAGAIYLCAKGDGVGVGVTIAVSGPVVGAVIGYNRK
ncbi:MAG: hypothetical protein E3J87_01945 [Candidatus Cloacimonadota bacterium]|nr:MAG: hypothetical protein E3J87_01945 [Candidatus Cloacimonadota bacterium]